MQNLNGQTFICAWNFEVPTKGGGGGVSGCCPMSLVAESGPEIWDFPSASIYTDIHERKCYELYERIFFCLKTNHTQNFLITCVFVFLTFEIKKGHISKRVL